MEELNEKIRQIILKYGTIAVDTMISLILPFMPPFLTKEQIHSIAIILITLVAPTMSVTGILNNPDFLSNMGIFCYKATSKTLQFGGKALYYGGKTTVNIVTSTIGIATDLLIIKPLYIICYPFRGHKQYNHAYDKIDLHQKSKKQEQRLNLKVTPSQDPDRIFFVIRNIDNVTNTVQVKMVGNLKKNDNLAKIMTFISQKDKGTHLQGVQFICNKNIINSTTKVGDLPKNNHGFVDLYYVKMQTFG